jgi:hypothetical protein
VTETTAIDGRIRELRTKLRHLFDSGHGLQDEGVLEVSRAIDVLVVAWMGGARRVPVSAADIEQ